MATSWLIDGVVVSETSAASAAWATAGFERRV
jgi:hypothetical protein